MLACVCVCVCVYVCHKMLLQNAALGVKLLKRSVVCARLIKGADIHNGV